MGRCKRGGGGESSREISIHELIAFQTWTVYLLFGGVVVFKKIIKNPVRINWHIVYMSS